MSNTVSSVAFIGGGNMAEAIICGMRKGAQTKDISISVCDIRKERIDELCEKYATRSQLSIKDAFAQNDLTVLAVKPQNFSEVLKEVSEAADAKNKIVLSIAAGVPLKTIAAAVPEDTQLVRVMPNLPCLEGNGASGYFAAAGTADETIKACETILACTGAVVRFDDEEELHAVTALSGSGPAYVFFFIDAMVKAAQKLGLTKKQALPLAIKTVSGSCTLLENSGLDAQELIARVASKGGTTEAALKSFNEQDCAGVVARAMQAAHTRSKELAQS